MSTAPDSVALLAESQRLLDEANRVERAKLADSLPRTLQRCREAAQSAHKRAAGYVANMEEVVNQVQAEIDRLSGSDQGSDTLLEQLKPVANTLQEKFWQRRDDVEEKRRRLDTFNITLLGRTMSGKSTLMEILTLGDGQSIGKGAQRTTRDVRSYEWQGLTVTDVPGIAAFGGQNDELTAQRAAMHADLILFLISDDGPQDPEARHLAWLREQGMVVLGIHNVHASLALNGDAAIRYFIRDSHKVFDEQRIKGIVRQFDELTDQYVPGPPVEFVPANLHARYLAGRQENQTKPWRDDLEAASRFQEVEERILLEVAANGPYLRERSFQDSATMAALQTMEGAQDMAGVSEQAHKLLVERRAEVNAWRRNFTRQANQEIDRLVQTTVGSLRNRLPSFAEENCENRDAGKYWETLVVNTDIDRKCRETQERLAQECRDFFQEIAADIEQEFRLLDAQWSRANLETGPIGNSRRWWKWGVNMTTSAAGIGVAGLAIANIWNPGGWVLAGILAGVGAVNLIGNLVGRHFGDRDQKRQERIANMKRELGRNLDEIERPIRQGMNSWLQEFTQQCVNKATEQFSQLTDLQQHIANLGRDISGRQCEGLLEVNYDTAAAALRHAGYPGAAGDIGKVARIPGQAMAIVTAGGGRLLEEAQDALQKQLNEAVVLVSDTANPSQAINSRSDLDPKARQRLIAQLS